MVIPMSGPVVKERPQDLVGHSLQKRNSSSGLHGRPQTMHSAYAGLSPSMRSIAVVMPYIFSSSPCISTMILHVLHDLDGVLLDLRHRVDHHVLHEFDAVLLDLLRSRSLWNVLHKLRELGHLGNFLLNLTMLERTNVSMIPRTFGSVPTKRS